MATPIPLTTPEFVRQSFLRGQATGPIDEIFLAALIASLSGSGDPQTPSGFEAYCDRVFPISTYIEYFNSDGSTYRLFPRAYPIQTAFVSVDTEYLWGTGTQLPAAEILVNQDGLPLIERRFRIPFYWGRAHIKVQYQGGLIMNAATVPPALALACAMQAGYLYQARNRLGMTGESTQGASVSLYTQATYLPQVRELLSPFVRIVL